MFFVRCAAHFFDADSSLQSDMLKAGGLIVLGLVLVWIGASDLAAQGRLVLFPFTS